MEAVLILVGATAVACFILVPQTGLLAVIACAAVYFVALLGDVFRGRFDGILLLWAGAFPFGYTVLAFPREHSIVTLDRVVILVAFMGLFLTKPSTLIPVPKTLRRAGLVWFAYIVIAGATLGKSANVLNAARFLLDGSLLPLLLVCCVLGRFDVRRRLPTLHTVVCLSSIICAAIAAAEIITRQDLLPDESSVIFFGGSIPRPNGPFETNDTLATVGAVSFFFLLFLRATLGPRLSSGRRMLHLIGLAATIGMALMPLFRSVAITLLLVLIIDTFWEQRTTRRAWRVVLILVSVGLIFTATKLLPHDMFEDRSSAANVYGRVAEFEQGLRVFVDHPMLGIGFHNFHEFVVGELRYLASYEGVSSLDWPHNNLTQALTETGLLGFVPYVLAQVLLLRAMWQLRKLGSCGYSVWKYYIYVFLCFWITGLTESSAYSPFAFWYMFVVAVFCKYVLTDPDLIRPAEGQVPDQALSSSARIF